MPTSNDVANRPAPPEDLSPDAVIEFMALCDELAALNRLDKADRAIIALAAETAATWRLAKRHVAQFGPVLPVAINGTVGRSPFYQVQKEMGAQLRGLLADLGLTPTSRKGGGGSVAGDLEW